jgi:hypothetical protein
MSHDPRYISFDSSERRAAEIMSSNLRIIHTTHDEVRGLVKFLTPSTIEQIAGSPLSPHFPRSMPATPRSQHRLDSTALTSSLSPDFKAFDEGQDHGHYLHHGRKQEQQADDKTKKRTPTAQPAHSRHVDERLTNKVYQPNHTSNTRPISKPTAVNSNISTSIPRYENPRPSPPIPPSPRQKVRNKHLKRSLTPPHTPSNKLSSRDKFLQTVNTSNSRLRNGFENVGQAFASLRLREGSPSSEESFDCQGVNYDAESKANDKLYKPPVFDIDSDDDDVAATYQEEEDLSPLRREAIEKRQVLDAVSYANALNGVRPLCWKCSRRSATNHDGRCQLCVDSAARAWTMPLKSAGIQGGGDLPSDYYEANPTRRSPPSPPPKDNEYLPRRNDRANRCEIPRLKVDTGEYTPHSIHRPDYLGKLAIGPQQKHEKDMIEIKEVGAKKIPLIVENKTHLASSMSAGIYHPDGNGEIRKLTDERKDRLLSYWDAKDRWRARPSVPR